MRIRLAIACLALIVALAPNSLRADDRETKPRPNILFLFTDDQRADTIHALGNATIRTPNLDRLVASGFTFRNAYCMGSDVPAVCLPSRTMLLSGRSLFHLKDRRRDAATLPKSLGQFGYFTYHDGKSGNTPHDIQRDFIQNHYLDDLKDRTSGFPGKAIADAASEFLNRRKQEIPFFMYLAFANPHDPRVAAHEFRNAYDQRTMPLPANFQPFHPFNNGELLVRDETLAPWPRSPDIVRKHLTDYYAVITGLDHEIGRILRALKTSGQYDNTIIIFSSDHGLALGSHGLFGKQSLYEHSMKAPLIIAGPGIPKGESDALVYLHDLYPTICDLVGAALPEGIDGRSLAPILRGEAQQVRDSIFLAYRNVQRAVRAGDWKLIRYPQIHKTQLFDLGHDPHEMHDLAGDSKYADKVRQLTALLATSQAEHGDTQPLSVEKPEPAEVDLSFFEPKKP